MAIELRNSLERWGAVAKAFHWIIVALILVQFALAWRAASLPPGLALLATLARHKSVGITVLLLAALRLAWRLGQRQSPPLPTGLPGWQRVLAQLSHAGLYTLLFALPLTGWMMSSARNYPVSWFGWFTLPDLVGPDQPLFERLQAVHGLLALALGLLAALHVAGALYHHFIRRDDVLLRMLPFARPRSSSVQE